MIARLAIVLALQAAALAWMVADRFALIESPVRATFRAVPVDPMDLLRGEYVILGYAFSEVGTRLADDGLSCGAGPALPEGLTPGDTVYVRLQETAPADWIATEVALAPDGAGAGQVLLRGRVTRISAIPIEGSGAVCRSASVRYGIESFFVPQGHGLVIEEAQRERRVTVEVAVAASGEAAIRSLAIDGEQVYAETLF